MGLAEIAGKGTGFIQHFGEPLVANLAGANFGGNVFIEHDVAFPQALEIAYTAC